MSGGFNYLMKRMIVQVGDPYNVDQQKTGIFHYCDVEIINIDPTSGLITCQGADWFSNCYTKEDASNKNEKDQSAGAAKEKNQSAGAAYQQSAGAAYQLSSSVVLSYVDEFYTDDYYKEGNIGKDQEKYLLRYPEVMKVVPPHLVDLYEEQYKEFKKRYSKVGGMYPLMGVVHKLPEWFLNMNTIESFLSYYDEKEKEKNEKKRKEKGQIEIEEEEEESFY
jgi:hypothetical protein